MVAGVYVHGAVDVAVVAVYIVAAGGSPEISADCSTCSPGPLWASTSSERWWHRPLAFLQVERDLRFE